MKRIFFGGSERKNKGIALLLAIVIAGLVLTIGVALSLLATKEFGLSNTGRDSQLAYYAAQTGANCAAKNVALFSQSVANSHASFPITCNGQTVPVDWNGTTLRYHFNFTLAPQPYDVDVYVIPDANGTDFTFNAKGHNTGNVLARRVEREVITRGASCFENRDIMIVVDTSVSIENNYVNGVRNPSNFSVIKSGVSSLVDQLQDNVPNAALGLIEFQRDVYLHHPLGTDPALIKATAEHSSPNT